MNPTTAKGRKRPKFRVGQRVYWMAGRSIVTVGKLTEAGFISKTGWAFSSYEVRPLTRRRHAMKAARDWAERAANRLWRRAITADLSETGWIERITDALRRAEKRGARLQPAGKRGKR